MKPVLLAALALGMGGAAMAGLAAEAPAPEGATPCRFFYTPKQSTVELEWLLPYAPSRNQLRELSQSRLMVGDPEGGAYEAMYAGLAEMGVADGWRQTVTFVCPMPHPPAGELVCSGTIRRSTGDGGAVEEPVHVTVDARQTLQVETAPPAVSGLQEPVLQFFRIGESFDHPFGFQATYTLTPQDGDVRFIAGSVHSVMDAPADGYPQTFVLVDAPFSPGELRLTERELELHVCGGFPDVAERDISCCGSIRLETARFAETRIEPLVADGKSHELRVSDATFSYTLTHPEEDTWYIEYTYVEPDGDEGELFDFGAFRQMELSGHIYTDPEDGRKIHTGAAELYLYYTGDGDVAVEDRPVPVLRVHPYTERKTVTLPISVSGHIRPPFPR